MSNGRFKKLLVLMLAFTTATHLVEAQQAKEPMTRPEWEKTYPAFRIVGNLYYVGTDDLACYLIVTGKGNILINTGLASSEKQIEKSIESLGFKLSDTKILLTSQAHYDHVGAMAGIKQQTGAILMADAKDAEVLETGGAADYEMGKHGVSFQPVKPDRLLNDGDTISLSKMHIKLLHHPGHTKGSCSFLFTVNDGNKDYRVLIANMPSIIVDGSFADVKNYPTIASDYAYTLEAMKKLSFDIWLAAHASQFSMHDKHQPGDAYNPNAFVDQSGYDETMQILTRQYFKTLEKNK